jgi:hypothetical protein
MKIKIRVLCRIPGVGLLFSGKKYLNSEPGYAAALNYFATLSGDQKIAQDFLLRLLQSFICR